MYFFSQISRFTEILLERDTDEEYKYYRVEKDEEDKEDPAHPTLLHLAAEQNFVHVAKLLAEKYPALVYLETEQTENERRYLPVEKALMSYKDETAAYLVSQMKHDWYATCHSYSNNVNIWQLGRCNYVTTQLPAGTFPGALKL